MSTTLERGTHGHEVSLERGLEARRLREQHGLTRPMLSDLIARSERSIYRWETEGITEENFRLIEQAVEQTADARADGAAGFSRLSLEALRQASTVDLALELVARARQSEANYRALEQLKTSLEHKGLSYLLPDILR